MMNWTVTTIATGDSQTVMTNDGQTPFDCGYDKDLHEAVEITPSELIVAEIELKRSTLIGAVKREAARRIDEIAPLWRQLNDLHEPESAGAIDRRNQINAIRQWSNDVEAEIAEATSLEALRDIFD